MEQGFQIRTYGFGELAQLYFPNISIKSASWQLTKCIDSISELKDELSECGKKPKQKILLPIQVKAITRFLGEPY